MSTAAHHLFTAAQIARALGGKRQAVQRILAGITPSGTVLACGNVAAAWSFSALPARLQGELTSAARTRGYRHAEAMLAAPWSPDFSAKLDKCPINSLRAEFIGKALKLRDALAAPLTQQHALSGPELTALGLREFTGAFGYTISAKQWNRIFDRTVQRDHGSEQWHRAELYLEDAAFQKPVARIAVVAKQFDHALLAEALAQLERAEKPTSEDRAFLFHSAFLHLEALQVAHAREHHAAIRASVVAFLHTSNPALSKSLPGLCRCW